MGVSSVMMKMGAVTLGAWALGKWASSALTALAADMDAQRTVCTCTLNYSLPDV